MLNPWLSSSSMAVRIQGLKGRHRTAQGNALGFDAIIAIKRCKRATILLLTPRHSNVVAQVSKPACRGFSAMYSSRFALFFSWGYPRRFPNQIHSSRLLPKRRETYLAFSTTSISIAARSGTNFSPSCSSKACRNASLLGCCSSCSAHLSSIS